MTDTLIFSLPAVPDADARAAHWWHIVDGQIVAAGADESWLAVASHSTVALAPVADARLTVTERSRGANSDRQSAAIARVEAMGESLGDPQTNHAVSAGVPEQPDHAATAIVANGTMIAWLEWCGALGIDPDHIVPVASLVPLTEDEWVTATVGTEHVAARQGMVTPFEPELAAILIGDTEVRALPDDKVQEALIHVAAAPPWLDLRSGAFAKRRRIVIDRDRIRELVLLACAIPLVTLLWAVMSILLLERSTDRLNAETLRTAEASLGRPATLETAEAELRQRAGAGIGGGLLSPLSALYRQLRAAPGVSTTDIAYRGDGTLSATIAAPTVDEVNRVLIDLQRARYGITAVPRQAPDGRAMVDVTIRSAP